MLAFQEAFKAAKASRLVKSWRGTPLQHPAVPTGSELMVSAKQAAQLLAALSEAATLPADAGAQSTALTAHSHEVTLCVLKAFVCICRHQTHGKGNSICGPLSDILLIGLHGKCKLMGDPRS